MEELQDPKESPGEKGSLSISPLVLIAFLYASGCLLTPYFPVSGGTTFLAALFTLIIAGAGYFFSYQRNHRVIYILFFFLGIVAGRLALAEAATPIANWSGHYTDVSGTVITEPDVRVNEVRYVLRLEEARVGDHAYRGGKVILVVRDAKAVFSYGDLLKARGLLRSPEPPGNPGDFDYAAYLARRGIGALIYSRGEDVHQTGGGAPNPLAKPALRLKGKLFKTLDAVFTPEHSALLKGIAFGTRTSIDPAVNEAFVETGVVHILSVSGLHIGLIVGFILGLTRFLRLRSGAVLLTVIPALLLYDFMVGFRPSVMRATVMALLLLWARHLGRERDWPTALAASALVILLANPLAVGEPGFQLSFAATWGILFLGPVLVDLFGRLGDRFHIRVKPVFAWAVAVPLGAQLGTLPLIVVHYNLVSVVALPANVVAVPLVGIVLLFGILGTILGSVFLPLGSVLAAPTVFLLDLLVWLVRFFQGLPGAAFYVPAVPWVVAGLWYGLLYMTVLKVTGRRLKPAPSSLRPGMLTWILRLLVFLLVILSWLGLMRWLGGGEPALRVDVIDVGQGDSVLVRTPGGGTLLVDAGGLPGELSGQRTEGSGMRVVQYLRRAGVRRLDVLVLTHPHEDHCGGARAVVEKLPVRLVVTPPVQEGIDAEYDRLLGFIRDRKIPVSTASAGDHLRLDPVVDIAVLSPFKPLSDEPGDFNDESLVLLLDYRGKSLLLTGDIEQEGQRRLLQYGVTLKSDVLKVPHHGSANFLPAFLKRVQSKIAVVSVGSRNRFGQPSPATLRELERLGARVYRTDRDGAILLRIRGEGIEVKTGRKAQRPAA
jgi:competence protein ComEC